MRQDFVDVSLLLLLSLYAVEHRGETTSVTAKLYEPTSKLEPGKILLQSDVRAHEPSYMYHKA
jgi:hypothetical protein